MSTKNSDPSFRGHTHARNGLGAKIKAAIDAGAKLDVEELADQFHSTEVRVREALRQINKKDPIYYSVGAKTGRNPQKGKIVNILKSQNDVREVVNRHDTNILAPRLEILAKQIERVVEKYPALGTMFQTLLLDKAARIAAIKQNINGNRKLTR